MTTTCLCTAVELWWVVAIFQPNTWPTFQCCRNIWVFSVLILKVQHQEYNGKCGICGDPYGADYQPHQYPGHFATGIIGRSYYTPGQVMASVLSQQEEHSSFIVKTKAYSNGFLRSYWRLLTWLSMWWQITKASSLFACVPITIRQKLRQQNASPNIR